MTAPEKVRGARLVFVSSGKNAFGSPGQGLRPHAPACTVVPAVMIRDQKGIIVSQVK